MQMYRSFNLVPFKTIIQYATAFHNRNIVVTNLLGNVAAFVPMGFLPPFIRRRLSRLLPVLVLAAAASIAVEVFQYVFGAGSADIDDVILNTAGGIFRLRILFSAEKLFARH